MLAQTGPGGVGTSTINTLWLDANDISQVDGSPISSWSDRSGNSNNATQGTAAYQPRFDSLIVNGNSVVRFDGTNDYFDDARTYNARTFFSVYNIRSGIQQTSDLGQIWGSYSEGWHVSYDARSGGGTWSFDGRPALNSGNTGRFGLNGANYGGFGANPNSPNWSYNQFDVVSVEFNATRTLTRQVIGSLVPSFSVGEHQYGGDVAEVIVYNTTLNLAQRIIVENYLSAKYGLTLSANDLYIGDNVAKGNHDYEVAGIGRIDASNIHNDAQGGIVRMLNPSNLGNNEFLMWGHNNGSLQSTNTSDKPTSMQARLDRVWRVSERNTANTASVDVGNIDIRWDLSGFGAITASDLRLLIDNDKDGLFINETPISGAISLGGGIYEFQNVNTLDDDEQFTLGTINTTQTPLPIDLISFNASPNDHSSVILQWQTAAEINNDFFTVERSINGFDWVVVKNIDGAGNSSKIINYKTVDNNPYFGDSYYRLKQTDFDGQFKYSSIKSVKLNKKFDVKIEIYPNPTSDKIMVVGSKVQLSEVRIFNMLGLDVSALTTMNNDDASTLSIDLSQLVNGIYFVKTNITAHKVYKK